MVRETVVVTLTLAWVSTSWGQPARTLEFVIDAPPHLAHVTAQLQSLDTGRLAGLIGLTGLTTPGSPIRIRVEHEESDVARDTPRWIAGFAVGHEGLVVLFPDRIGAYPYGSLEKVLYHETTHVLASRAAGGRPLPRWFNEGLASAAERSGGLERRTRLAWELLASEALTPTRLEALFSNGPRETVRAYIVSDALVRHIFQRHGASTGARILQGISAGSSFELAFFSATGMTVDETFIEFWSHNAIWQRWIGFLGHPFTVWSFVTLLALAAIWRHRRRRIERRLRWELEERAEDEAWEEHRRKHGIH